MNSRCQMSSSAGAIRTGCAASTPGASWLPLLVDEGHAVPHPVNQVHELVADERLRQPVQILEAHDEPGVVQRARGRNDGRRLDEQIEILRLPVDAGVLVDRVGARRPRKARPRR